MGPFFMSKAQRLLCLSVLVLNNTYLLWLLFNIRGVLGLILLITEVIFTFSFNMFVFNHWSQKNTGRSFRKATGSLDVFLPVVNEPLEIFETTLKAAAAIYYQDIKVYVLDDGNREEIRRLANAYGAVYLARPTHEHSKAGNLNYGLRHSKGDFILCLDADQVVSPNIAIELLGHFQTTPKLAYVTTRQKYLVPSKDFNNDYLFYLHMQAGKNRHNAAISTGTGVFVK